MQWQGRGSPGHGNGFQHNEGEPEEQGMEKYSPCLRVIILCNNQPQITPNPITRLFKEAYDTFPPPTANVAEWFDRHAK
jgi:hypothetical protein